MTDGYNFPGGWTINLFLIISVVIDFSDYATQQLKTKYPTEFLTINSYLSVSILNIGKGGIDITVALASTTSHGDPRIFQIPPFIHEYRWHSDQSKWFTKNLVSVSGKTALCAISVNGDPRVYYQGIGANDLNIYELAFQKVSPLFEYWKKLTVVGAPLDASTDPFLGTTLASITRNGFSRVYYQNNGGKIIEAGWDGGKWILRRIHDEAGGPVSSQNVMTAFSYHEDPRIYYLGGNDHIYELAYWSRTNQWANRDLTTGNVPNAAHGGLLTAPIHNGDPRVYYLGYDYHVNELAYWGGGWHHLDLTTRTSAAPAAGGSSLTSIFYNGGPVVYYLGTDRCVHRLGFAGGWSRENVTTSATGEPIKLARIGSPLTAITYGGNPRVYYLDDNYHIQELAFNGNKWVHIDVYDRAIFI